VPRDVASRAAKQVCDEGRGVGPGGLGVYLDFAEALERLGERVVREKYGNLFHMYEKITAEDPYRAPMRIYPAVHYTMGGLWVDYDLMSTIPGLYVIGEANFSDHGANRLGASALMQGLADGYFVLPYTIGDFLARVKPGGVDADHAQCRGALEEARARIGELLAIRGERSPDSFHKQLGQVLWDRCGMGRDDAGLRQALAQLPEIRAEFAGNLKLVGRSDDLNQALEKAGRVADFLEFAELLVRDALHRTESCGGHFRLESQTEDGEALRDDERFAYVAAWEHRGDGAEPALHREPLAFEHCKPSQRSYK
jgi:succinate dehydrogenase / fumarate reductase flavoprotein subunit